MNSLLTSKYPTAKTVNLYLVNKNTANDDLQMFYMNTNNIIDLQSSKNQMYLNSKLDKYQINTTKDFDTQQKEFKFSLFHGIYYDIFNHYQTSYGQDSKFSTEQELLDAINKEYSTLKLNILKFIADFESKITCRNINQLISNYSLTQTMMFLDSYLEIKTLNSKINFNF